MKVKELKRAEEYLIGQYYLVGSEFSPEQYDIFLAKDKSVAVGYIRLKAGRLIAEVIRKRHHFMALEEILYPDPVERFDDSEREKILIKCIQKIEDKTQELLSQESTKE